jgi:tetratricopeptide (TPR) repeat protein
MADIFLSYDRDDEARARPVAALFERSGHSVWWDRAIKGGHEFGAEIEAALEAADKIVVLWSEHAVRSAWVRDEAAVGRDTGRLVPATIDGTAAPLGFRQFQTIDLSKWKGRGSSRQVEDLLNAIETDGAAVTRPSHSEKQRFNFSPSRPLLLGGGTVLAIAAAALLVWQFWPRSGGPPTFSIVPADSSSSSRQLAADVATRLSGMDDPSDADFRVVDAASGQVSGYGLRVATSSKRVTLSLISNADNAIVWSSPLDLSQNNQDDISQVVSITARGALSCAADAVSHRREKIDQQTLKLYMAGCTSFDDAYGTNSSDTNNAKLLQSVIAKAPHFAAAWSKLFEVETDILYSGNRDAAAGAVRSQLEQARQLGIDVPEAYAVKAGLLPSADYLGIFRTFDEGIRKHPDNAFLFRLRGERSMNVGRMTEAVGDIEEAVQLDPLSSANQQSFASVLAYAGRSDTGYAQLNKADHLWPNSLTLGLARYRMDLRFGDPREAQQLFRKYAAQVGQNQGQEKFIEARINPTPENIESALDAERRINRQFPPFIASLIQALGYFGRKDEAIDLMINYPGGASSEFVGGNSEVLFRPMMRDVWRDPRSMAGAARMGLLHYWKVSGKWPDFCFDPKLPYDCRKEAAKYRV